MFVNRQKLLLLCFSLNVSMRLSIFLIVYISQQVPPVLIPNTEVKLSRAESTRRATDREDRLLPLSIKPLVYTKGFLLVFFDFIPDICLVF